jgi:NADPH-dependent 2,4-dienoyl-CoA reductase/sulfur reductase-like enzyme
MTEQVDAVVVGAGPAGMAAASLLAERGARTVLLDEQPAPGGQIYRGIEQASPALRALLGPDYEHGAALAERLRASGVEYRPGSAVWNITSERYVWVIRNGAVSSLQTGVVLLATGAMERPVPVPGWTLPGVMGAGAVQILLKTACLRPDSIVLAGSGPLLYLLAAQLLAAGTTILALLDTTARRNEFAALRHLPGPAGWGVLAKGLQLKAELRAAGVAVWRRVSDLRIEGKTAAEAIHFTASGQQQRIATTLVALHEGVIPAQQITRALGCAHQWSDAQRCFRPVLDEWGNTSLPGILVAGDAAGIAGARAAAPAGRLAAAEALRQLGRLSAAARDDLAAPDRRAHAKHLKARAFLDTLYPPPAAILRPADDVVVCRCEEVTAGQLRAVARQGCQGPNQAKSFLRAGMGPCQGRLCGPVVSEILAETLGRRMDDIGYYRIRPPLKPVTVGELAGAKIGDDSR